MMFQSSMVRTLVAACIVPLIVIGGPGTPMGRALAAGRDLVADALFTPWESPESVGRRAMSPGSRGIDSVPTLGTSSFHHPDGMTSVVRPDRVVALESGAQQSGGEAAGARLVDGDASTTVRPEHGGAVRIIAHFGEPLWLDGLSLSGDGMGELRLLSATSDVPILELGGSSKGRSAAAAPPTPRRYELDRPLWGQTFHFEWVPGSLELPSEWTFWRRGAAAELSLGEDAELFFTRGTLAGASEYWAEVSEVRVSAAALYQQSAPWGQNVAPAASAETSVQVSDLGGKGRAFLVYELEGAPHFTAIRRSINGKAALGGARGGGRNRRPPG